MTQNGYGIHEGPVSYVTDPFSGDVEMTAYTEHHVFAHISPKLTMVLRSALLPLAVEDVDEGRKAWRETMNSMTTLQHGNPEAASSFLQDLPVTKPKNSYTTFVDGLPVPIAEGEEPIFSKADKFYFTFFRLSREHVGKINCVLLEEAYVTSQIVFNKKVGACNALRYYLTMDPGKGKFKWKQVARSHENDPRLQYLKKLEVAVAMLGGEQVVAKYCSKHQAEEEVTSMISEFRAQFRKDQLFIMISKDQEAMSIYAKLCNKTVLDGKDFDQARIMLKLRIKIDTWSRGLDESIRNRIREDLRAMYCQLPVHRLWLYLKRLRFMFSSMATIVSSDDSLLDLGLPVELLRGPEDLVAERSHLFLPKHRCRIMYYATFNAMNSPDASPEFAEVTDATSDEEMIRRLRQEKALAFGSQGSICDCGVPHVQKLARKFKHALETEGFPGFGERIELATRIRTMNVLLRKLKGKGKSGDGGTEQEDLFGILFGFVFPIFGSDEGQESST